MEDEIYPGQLSTGACGSMEGDLGRRLRPLAGFGRELEPVEEEVWEGVVFTPEFFANDQFSTRRGAVVYSFTTWNQLDG